MRLIPALFLLALGCEDPVDECIPLDVGTLELYVDSSCQRCERKIILEAVERVNEAVEELICRPIIEVPTIIGVDKYHEHPGTNVDVAVCYHDEPLWYGGSGFEKWNGCVSHYDDISAVRFFIFKTQFLTLPLAMHELIHYLGVHRHAYEEDDVMFSDPSRETVTENDKELIFSALLRMQHERQSK